MKTSVKFGFVFVFVAVGMVFIISRQTPAEAAVEVETLAASRALYRQHCATCHGNDGHSQTRRGRETEADDLTTGDVKSDAHDKIVRIITNGKGDMPGFKRKLSATQIASIARYIKTL